MSLLFIFNNNCFVVCNDDGLESDDDGLENDDVNDDKNSGVLRIVDVDLEDSCNKSVTWKHI